MKSLSTPAAVLIVAALGLGLSACKQTDTTTSPTPTVTETFSGTLQQGSSNTHPFHASAAGAVNITLTAVGPLSTMAIGIAAGSWDGTTCSLALQNDNMRLNSVLSGQASQVSNLCAVVYDSGNVTTEATYTITIEHP